MPSSHYVLSLLETEQYIEQNISFAGHCLISFNVHETPHSETAHALTFFPTCILLNRNSGKIEATSIEKICTVDLLLFPNTNNNESY